MAVKQKQHFWQIYFSRKDARCKSRAFYMTPNQRTITLFKKGEIELQTVERFIPGANVRKDLFGIIDFLCIINNKILGIQSTGTAFSEHHQKIMIMENNLRLWLSTGSEFILIGWRKLKGKYKPRIQKYTLENGVIVIEEIEDVKQIIGKQNGQ